MQNIWTDINELTTSGTQLADLLDQASETLRSSHLGTTRPPYATEGLIWLQVPNLADLTQGPWTLNFFDGNNDIAIYQIDPVSHALSFGGNNALSAFKVSRTDTLADLLELAREVNTANNSGGFIYTQNNDADEKTTFGKALIESSSVADGSEGARFLISLLKNGALQNVFNLDPDKLILNFLAGSGARNLVATSTGQLKASSSEYAPSTAYLAGEWFIRERALYLVTTDFTSHATEFSNDLGNVRKIEDPGQYINTSQDLANNASIAIAGFRSESVELNPTSGSVSASNTPFGTTEANFSDRQTITVLNVHASNEVTIPVNDADFGYVGNGVLILKRGYMVTFEYSATLKRFLAKSQNF